jgi:NitT/TauT family transport system substrate-binding protein
MGEKMRTKKSGMNYLVPILISGLMLMFIFAVGCTPNNAGDAKAKGSNQLRIGSLPIEDNLPILVALQNGYFAAENLDVQLIPFQSPVESQSAFQSGELDGMVTDMLIAALLRSSGEDLRITSLTLGATPAEGRFAIVASPQSNIFSPSDLKGKSIGISTNSIIEYVTDGLLEEAGLKPSDVEKIVTPKIPVRIEMLLSNQIDAITVPDPHVSYVVAEGAKVIAEDTQGENLTQAVLIMTNKTLDTKKESMVRFYKAYTQAVEDINSAPEEYRELLLKNVNIPPKIADTYQVQHYSKPQLPAEKEVNKVLTWLKNKNLLKNEVTYEGLIQKGLY